jgi:hypothetical protein
MTALGFNPVHCVARNLKVPAERLLFVSDSVVHDLVQWQSIAGSLERLGGTTRISGQAGAAATLTFDGTTVSWITSTGPAYGRATVSIDGINRGRVDLYAPQVAWQAPKTYGGLASGNHTIVVAVSGTKNKASSAKNVVVDAFIVLPKEVATHPPYTYSLPDGPSFVVTSGHATTGRPADATASTPSPAISTSRQSALARISCSAVRQWTPSSAGEHTSTAMPWAREIATLRRFRL